MNGRTVSAQKGVLYSGMAAHLPFRKDHGGLNFEIAGTRF